MDKKELTQAKVRHLFDYNPITGEVVRKVTTAPKGKKGTIVGIVSGNGHLQVRIDGKKQTLHRIIWLWMVGELPKNEIDHINHAKTDNRWINLRKATHQENGVNQRRRKNNVSGVTGVYWSKGGSKWMAQITSEGKPYYLGSFKSFSDACFVRKKAEKDFGFHPNHGLDI